MKKVNKLICLVLLCILIFAVACDKNGGQDKNRFAFSSYFVVYENENEEGYAAAKKVQAAVREACGAIIALRPDTVEKSGNEIVLGNTSRVKFSEELKLKDFKILVKNDGTVTVATGSNAALSAAADKLISDFIVGKNAFVVGQSCSYDHAYRYENILLNRIPVEQYQIVCGEGAESTAQRLVESVAENAGVQLSFSAEESAEGEREIRIGAGDRIGTPVFSPVDYAIYAQGQSIVLNASAKALSDTDAADSFIALFEAEAENKVLSVNIDEKIVIYEGKLYTLAFVSATRTAVLGNGVNQYEFHYTNSAGKPIIVYAMEVKADSGCKVVTGTPNDGYVVGNHLSQSVLDMANAGRQNGRNIVFAMNSGFFDIDYDQMPEGVVVKDGKVLSQGFKNFAREWWGVKSDGSIEFGTYDELFVDGSFRTDLVQAAGGNHLLYKDGKEVEIIDSDAALLAANPRSCFVARKNGDLVFLVADGRQPNVSVGLTMQELKEIAYRMGAYDALNLDGGGSSQFVAWDAVQGKLRVVNKPVGLVGETGLRKVADCIWIVKE